MGAIGTQNANVAGACQVDYVGLKFIKGLFHQAVVAPEERVKIKINFDGEFCPAAPDFQSGHASVSPLPRLGTRVDAQKRQIAAARVAIQLPASQGNAIHLVK